MNNAHIHLVLNHLPIIFPIVGTIIILIGIFTKSEVSKRNAYIIFILGAIASIAAMATGESAEEAVENLPGVAENLIKTHEEAAELFAALSYFLGGISLIALISNVKNFGINKFIHILVLILAVATLYFAQEAGRTGGEIRHTEIRSGATFQNGDQGEKGGENNQKGKEKDDD